MSPPADSDLADREQTIADLQRRLVEAQRQLEECTVERDEALARERATTEVLGVINASPGNLTPVFDAMLERAMRLCGAAFGQLSIYDGERFRTAATRGMPAAYVEFRRNNPPNYGPGTAPARVLAGERVIVIDDLKAEPAYAAGEPNRRAFVDLGGARSDLLVALTKDEAALGFIEIYRQEVRPFTDKEVALLQNFAAQAVIAMENARLITETREALEQQTATAEVLGVINSSPADLAPVFDAMLEKAMRLIGAAFGIANTYDGKLFRTAALHKVPPALAGLWSSAPPKPGPNSALTRLASGEDVVHIEDYSVYQAYKAGDPRAKALVELGGVRTYLAVPLRKDGTLLGTIAAYRQEVRPYSEKQIALLQNFAAQAVIAMENARLITETREALEQQTATAEVLGVINSSPGDLAPVFDVILGKAHSLCGAELGVMLTFDGERFWPVAAHGASARFLEAMGGGLKPRDDNPFARIIDGAPIVHIEDILPLAAEHPDEPGLRLAAEIGLRTFLIVALRKDGVLLGAFTANRREIRPFTGKQIALLENFAAQAVIAIDNARLLGELRQRTEEVADLNRGLEARIAEQVEELGRVGRLKRFLAPQLAELIVSQGDEKILESHRREIVVVFCDLRGYTAFTETAEPEEVLDFLREYHGALGPLVAQYEGTLDQFSGDGIMVFFNDPVPIPDPAERAVRMAVAMREAGAALISSWRRLGRDLGFGAGIAQGYATLGQIGFSERSGYTAIGTVCNVAARLCAEAKDGQILISQRVAARLDDNITLEDIGPLTLKGLTQPVVAFNVPLATGQPALRVIEGGPQSV